MNIVLALDGSKFSRWAMGWVRELPFARPRHVSALHVIDVAALRAPFVVQPAIVGCEPLIKAEVKRLEAQAKRVTAEARRTLVWGEEKARVLIKKGPVAPTILASATRRDALIVVGQRGLSNLDRFFLGSVSTQVTGHASCSVLVVKAPARPLHRVILAVDGSKSSERALHFLLHQMRPMGDGRVQVRVLQVLPPFAYANAAMAGMALTARYARKLEAAGYLVKESIEAGDPAEEILKAAKTSRADLLVVGAKGLSAVGRFVLGSVSSKLIRHSPCSILIVR